MLIITVLTAILTILTWLALLAMLPPLTMRNMLTTRTTAHQRAVGGYAPRQGREDGGGHHAAGIPIHLSVHQSLRTKAKASGQNEAPPIPWDPRT